MRALVNQAVILVGGRGTRLGTLTDKTPKPMLMVGRRPFLEYQLAWLRRNGVTDILFCCGYKAGAVEKHFGNGSRFGLRVAYSVENEPVGTGGCLRLASSRLADVFFALNGDTIFEADLCKLESALSDAPQALACLALRHVENAGRFGKIELNRGMITGFSEKGGGGPAWINGGIYCFRRKALELLPAPPCSLENDLFPKLAATRQLMGCGFEGFFIDIGVPEAFTRAQTELPSWLSSFNAKRMPQ